MQVSFIRLPLVSIVLVATMAPALAGNYAEGDPRPAALTSSTSRAAVEASTRTWMLMAPPTGYSEGEPRPVALTGQLSRDVVKAETMAWINSGLAALQYGEYSADASSPAYVRAARAFTSLRNAGQDSQTSQAPVAPVTKMR